MTALGRNYDGTVTALWQWQKLAVSARKQRCHFFSQHEWPIAGLVTAACLLVHQTYQKRKKTSVELERNTSLIGRRARKRMGKVSSCGVVLAHSYKEIRIM